MHTSIQYGLRVPCSCTCLHCHAVFVFHQVTEILQYDPDLVPAPRNLIKIVLLSHINYGQPETWDYNFLTPTATYLNSKLLSRKLNCHNVLFKLTMVLCVFLLFLYMVSVSYSSTQIIAASCGLAEKVSLSFIILKLMFITLMWHMCSLYVLMPRIEAPT